MRLSGRQWRPQSLLMLESEQVAVGGWPGDGVNETVNIWIFFSSKCKKLCVQSPLVVCKIPDIGLFSTNNWRRMPATSALYLQYPYSREFCSLDWDTHLWFPPCSVYEIRVIRWSSWLILLLKHVALMEISA